MGTTADKLQAILNSKNDIKAAIEEKGVSDVGDILSTYADKIRSISTGGGGGGEIKWTGHADVEGLKAIGWTDEDIEYFQNNGVNWNEEYDEYNKVPQDNIALYGKINASNISTYKDILVYLPKIDTSSVTNMNSMFSECRNLKFIPELDTSSVTNMYNMFNRCYNLVSIPKLDTSSVTNMYRMFYNCYNLTSIPELDTSNVTNMIEMFDSCYNLVSIPKLDTSSVTDMGWMFNNCFNLKSIPELDASNVTRTSGMFTACYSLTSVSLLNTSNVESMYDMFKSCFNLIYVSELNTSKVTDIGNMFRFCCKLKSISFRIMNSSIYWDQAFNYCFALQSLIIYNPLNKPLNRLFIDQSHSIINFKLEGLNNNLAIISMNLLTKDSLLYIIQNSTATSNITIALSDYIYNKFSSDPDIVAALEEKPYVALAL